MHKREATRRIDGTTDDAKRRKVVDDINPALQAIINNLEDYDLIEDDDRIDAVNTAVVGLTKWINKEDESPQANKIEASERILNCYLAQLEGKTDVTLIKLRLSGLELETLPAEIGNLTNMQCLHLLNNQLRELPVEIGNLTNLVILDFKKNKLKTLPVEIGKLTNLRMLSLDDNQLTSVEGIEQLTNLGGLSLANNQLTSVEGVGQLTNLTYLSLSNNQLTSVEGVEKLTNLTGLFLSNNQLTSVEGVGKLTNLQGLYLDNNYLPETESGKLPEHMIGQGVGTQKGVEELKKEFKKLNNQIRAVFGYKFIKNREIGKRQSCQSDLKAVLEERYKNFDQRLKGCGF